MFTNAVKIVLEDEGVFSNDSKDTGGETYYGISRVAHPTLTPWPPTKDQAIAVYQSDYWEPHSCGDMPWDWALGVFDGVVNQGLHVIHMAQEALGVQPDGVVGVKTLAAMHASSAYEFQLFLALRLRAYTMDSEFKQDGKGWFRRVIGVAMAAMLSPGD